MQSLFLYPELPQDHLSIRCLLVVKAVVEFNKEVATDVKVAVSAELLGSKRFKL